MTGRRGYHHSLRRLLHRTIEVLGEILERAHDRARSQSTHGTERTVDHRGAQVIEQLKVLVAVNPGDDLVDHLDAPDRADAAGCALAAGLDRTELHRKTRLSRHVDAIVEDDDAAMADH